jgi:hypothetical protein
MSDPYSWLKITFGSAATGVAAIKLAPGGVNPSRDQSQRAFAPPKNCETRARPPSQFAMIVIPAKREPGSQNTEVSMY